MREALVHQVGEAELATLTGFLDALRGGDWMFASSALEFTSFCAADSARCSTLSALVQSGCPAPDFWLQMPLWPDVLASFNVSGAGEVSVATGSGTLTLSDASISISGQLSCGGVKVAAHFPFSQRDINITFQVV